MGTTQFVGGGNGDPTLDAYEWHGIGLCAIKVV